ncbi:MAG TPA: NAD(P)-binding protein [Steroidobacteraceae bacterium]
MGNSRTDLTPVVDLLAEPGTGPYRARRPVYRDLLPPCNHACPAGERVQTWLAHAAAGHPREAWEALVQDNPFPAVQGRVCYHPCESSCNRQELDGAVSIHAVERFLGDLALREGWPLPPAAEPRAGAGKRVLIVGAGPAGLAAAYHLRRLGHIVEIHDAEPLPGGMMRFGIPAYRLPRDVLAAEVRRIEALGVRIIPDHRVEDLVEEKEAGNFDAAFVAIGAHVSQRIDLPAQDAARLLDALPLLHGVSLGERPQLGRRVVVYGGGNTAMDAARTVMRLGGTEPLIIYRRDRAHMTAHAFEAAEAEEEGIRFQWLTSIRRFTGGELTVERMELDAQGRPQPTGQLDRIAADSVVLAVGQSSESAFLGNVPGVVLTAGGTLEVGPHMMTGRAGVFAGGDLVPGERTVTAAMGHGRRAALHIDSWLRGREYVPAPLPPVVSRAMLHLPIFSDVLRSEEARRPASSRAGDFAEVVARLTEAQAHREAARCLSCGTCFECDTCYAACPERAIGKLGAGRRYEIHYERCTGCAVCFEACPCHAIDMVAEPG